MPQINKSERNNFEQFKKVCTEVKLKSSVTGKIKNALKYNGKVYMIGNKADLFKALNPLI
jgi:hypothetical protein